MLVVLPKGYLINLSLFSCELCWPECLSILWSFIENSWNHYKHTSVHLPMEKSSCHFSYKERLEADLKFGSHFFFHSNFRDSFTMRALFSFLFFFLLNSKTVIFGQSSYVYNKNVLFINSQPKFGPLYART